MFIKMRKFLIITVPLMRHPEVAPYTFSLHAALGNFAIVEFSRTKKQLVKDFQTTFSDKFIQIGISFKVIMAFKVPSTGKYLVLKCTGLYKWQYCVTLLNVYSTQCYCFHLVQKWTLAMGSKICKLPENITSVRLQVRCKVIIALLLCTLKQNHVSYERVRQMKCS